MKEHDNKNRTKVVTYRVTPEEFRQIKNKANMTTTPLISEYIQIVLLQGEITIFTRNQSLDAFMSELIRIRKELNAIGNNYNQAVKNLHSYANCQDIKAWLLFNETTQRILSKKIEEIKSYSKIGSTWWP